MVSDGTRICVESLVVMPWLGQSRRPTRFFGGLELIQLGALSSFHSLPPSGVGAFYRGGSTLVPGRMRLGGCSSSPPDPFAPLCLLLQAAAACVVCPLGTLTRDGLGQLSCGGCLGGEMAETVIQGRVIFIYYVI